MNSAWSKFKKVWEEKTRREMGTNVLRRSFVLKEGMAWMIILKGLIF